MASKKELKLERKGNRKKQIKPKGTMQERKT